MISMIIDFLQLCLIMGALAFIITFMVKQDLKDENNKTDEEDEKEIEIESEVTKSVTEVIYFESMSPNEKLDKITVELNKIEKLIPPDRKLNDFDKCLTEIRGIKRKFDKVYDNGQIQLNNAISWLEKPLVTRGKYKPVPYDEDEITGLDIDCVEKSERLITVTVTSNSILMNTDPVDNYSVDDDESDLKSEKSVSENTSKYSFKIPEIKLQNLFEAKDTINRFWPMVKFWSLELFYDMLQSMKIWFTVLIIVGHSIFKWNNLENVINPVSKQLRKFIIIQTNVNKEDDVTSITLIVFPKKTERTKRRLERVWTYLKNFWT